MGKYILLVLVFFAAMSVWYVSLERGDVSIPEEDVVTEVKSEKKTGNTIETVSIPVEEDQEPAETTKVEEVDEEIEEAPTSVATPDPSVPPASLEWGAFAGYSANDLKEFEEMVGKPVDIRTVFVNWGTPFPNRLANELFASDKKMLLFWEHYGFTLDSIIAGEHDEYIKEFRNEAANYDGEIILAPFHEMNGNWDGWGGAVGNNTPGKVILAWQHIFGIFQGVTNVKFAWTVNSLSVPNIEENNISHYYPGEAYVDYVAVDGFNFGTPWQSFERIFGNVLSDLKSYNKPIYILSMASAGGPKKADWITDTFKTQIPKHPEIVGWVWFNEDKERDWRVNSDSASLKAFRAILP